MSEKENFLEGFKKADIIASAKLDIKPRLTIDLLGVENGKDVLVCSKPYRIKLPKDKAISKDGKVWMLDVHYEGVDHQFIAQAGSFRYQLGVLVEKYYEGNMDEIVGKTIKISKDIAMIKTPEFTGKAEVYQVALIE